MLASVLLNLRSVPSSIMSAGDKKSQAAPQQVDHGDLLITIQSKRPYSEVVSSFASVAVKYKFGVVATHDMNVTFDKKGITDFKAGQVTILEVCEPHSAKNVLQVDVAISTMLPCRVAVTSTSGAGCTLQTMKPSLIASMFKRAELQEVAQFVETQIHQLMTEVATGTAATAAAAAHK